MNWEYRRFLLEKFQQYSLKKLVIDIAKRVKQPQCLKYKLFSYSQVNKNNRFFEIDDGNKLSTSPDINFDNTIPNGDEKTTVSNKISTSHYISDPCFEKGICNSDGISERGYCNCDVGCIEYNDCCSEALENVSYISKYHKYWNCYAHSNIREYFGGFFVVASCPNGYENGTVVSRCHEIDIIKNGPCVVYDNEIAFQNRFCALCHNITEFKFCKLKIYGPDVYSIFHRIGYSNKTKSEKLKVLLETDFDFLVDLPIESKSRFCMSSLIESTDVICRQSSINPVYQYRRGLPYFYKNIFCAPENIRESLLCVNDNFQRFVDPTKSLFPLTVMFSFSSEKENQDKDGCKLWTEAVSTCQC
ncbi:unnamed protein product [Mytilus coruscus]|uniref:SMB domain-containing protein n=1 Tax=Mytilus coruscus TaxID=42192 RepID=A0A6J8AYP8_MYTCO|nr:unnamed protein product [Mytilus coruscus]